MIATPVACVATGCNNYYKSTQPDASRMIHFMNQCNAGLGGWTCCLDSSSYLSGDEEQLYEVTTNMKKTSKKSKK